MNRHQPRQQATSTPVPPRSPAFGNFDPEAVAEDVLCRIEQARERVKAAIGDEPQALIAALELIGEDLERRFAPLRHMNSVASTSDTRAAYEKVLAALTDYQTWLGQHQGLYRAFKNLAAADDFAERPQAEQALLTHALTGFRLAGAELPQAERETVRALLAELAELGNRFEKQLLDATEAWQLTVTDRAELAGLPEAVIDLLEERARDKKQQGWFVTLDPGVVIAILTHADHRPLRREVYEAWVSRASDAGPNGGRFDNGPVIEAILADRRRLAHALGYTDYAEYALVERMAASSGEVEGFLHDLIRRARPKAEEEFAELDAFAGKAGLEEPLAPWDIGYYSEKLRRERYAIDEERLRQYFPLEHVLEGLRTLFHKLYNLHIQVDRDSDTWHPDVRVWTLSDDANQRIGKLYLDLYARRGKRGGAWMDEGGHKLDLGGVKRLPTAFLTANFLRPAKNKPSLISHDDAVTLCHELGHCLHHLLTRVNYPSVGGISGVEWDAVEFPSQLHEEFAWHPAGLGLLAADSDAGTPMPRELLEALGQSRRFHGAMHLVRQLEFALFDLDIHRCAQRNPSIAEVRRVLADARAAVRVTPVSVLDRFECTFAHIFGGGYAAGYYSYLWAEVMARDGFGAFTAGDRLRLEGGRALAATTYAAGGSRPARDLYRAFRGRNSDPAALLAMYGIA